MNRLIAIILTLILAGSACTPIATKPPAIPTVETSAVSTKPVDVLPSRIPDTATSPTQPSPKPSQTSAPVIESPIPTYTPSLSPTVASTPTSISTPLQPARQSQAIIVDHNSVDLFDQIPDEYLKKAQELRMMYADASVGQNINDALNCLTAPNWATSPSPCRNDYIDQDWNWTTYNGEDYAAGRVPARILFTPDPVKYDRSNWVFEFLSSPWPEMLQKFIEDIVPAYVESTDVLSYQFNYFHVADNSKIADPEKGFFVDSPNQYDYKDLENIIAQHPDKTFFYWTTSLARVVGTQTAVEFNNQMRQYVLDNDLILFDVADIESHTDQGVPCYDARDGIEYCSRRPDGTTIKCENEPDDGLQLPAICQDYTTEPDGGHLGSVSAGHLRLAKALWVLMARIAGWQP